MISLGVMEMLLRKIERVGFFRPIIKVDPGSKDLVRGTGYPSDDGNGKDIPGALGGSHLPKVLSGYRPTDLLVPLPQSASGLVRPKFGNPEDH